jgi:hypothetical protein
MVFDSFLHENKVKNKIRGHIRNPREKADRTIRNVTSVLKISAPHMWPDCLPTALNIEFLILSKRRIARCSDTSMINMTNYCPYTITVFQKNISDVSYLSQRKFR